MSSREVIRPPADEREAAAVEATIGYLVAAVDQGSIGPVQFIGHDLDQARTAGIRLAIENPGREFALFSAMRTFKFPKPPDDPNLPGVSKDAQYGAVDTTT